MTQWCGRQGIGGCIQAHQRVTHLAGHGQAQMALGQDHGRVTHHGTQPLFRFAHAVFQHLRVALTGDPVGQHASPRHIRLVMLQAKRQRAKGARHGPGINHRQHRQAKTLRQIGRAGCSVKQAHDPFDQDQVRLTCCRGQTRAAVGLAIDPQVELIDRCAAGELMPDRIQKIWPALEHPDSSALAGMQPCQGGNDRGFALA
jgi:hypothetical protein